MTAKKSMTGGRRLQPRAGWMGFVCALAILAGLPAAAPAAIQQVAGGLLFTGTNSSTVLISTNNGAILSVATGGGAIAASGEAGLWAVSYLTNGSSSRTGSLWADAFSAGSSTNIFQWSLPGASNVLYLTYSNADLTVVVAASNRDDGVEFSAAVTPRASNVLSLTLPAPLRFSPASLQRFIAPSHSSDGVGMAYNATYFQAQPEDTPASWKQAVAGPAAYTGLYGGPLVFGAYTATNLSFTTNGVVWLGAGLSNEWHGTTAVVNRPPGPGQADVVLIDSPNGAFLSGSHLGGGPGAGYLMRIGGAVDASRVQLSLDVVVGAIEHLSQSAGGRTNVAMLSLVRGPVIGESWPSEVRLDEWRARLTASSVLAGNGIGYTELTTVPDMIAALSTTNLLAILNPYGELVPASLGGGVPATATNIGNFVRGGGHWFEVGGHPFYQALQPELYYTNNVLYPPAFADFLQVETTNGSAALYGVQPVPDDPWSGQTNTATLFVPGHLVWGGDASGGWLQRAFGTYVATGQTWQSPRVRLTPGRAAADALRDYGRANDFSRGLTNKMAPALLDQFRQSVMIRVFGNATQLTARLPQLPAPAVLHFEQYLYGGFDKQYPDHLPPSASFGTTAQFTNFLGQARQRGQLTMPYTNPTFWGVDPKGPTFLATNDAPLLVNLDGTYTFEQYFGNGGLAVSPWHPAVQAANRNTRNQFLTNYPVDILFQDQIGARTWQYDTNAAVPAPYAYAAGLAAIAGEDSQSIPLSTENGWDRLINHEAQFCGLAWGLAPTTNAPFWRRYLRERYAPSTWQVFPLAQYLAHDKVSMVYNDLSAAVHNHEVMAWTLGLGYGMTYVIDVADLDDVAERQWLLWIDRVQKSVVTRYLGQGVNAFSHQWGTNAVDPDNGVLAATYGPVSVVGNLGPQTLVTNGYTLPGYGYLATATGLVAGRLVAPGASAAVAYVAESNGASSVRFWIYATGGQDAQIVLPAGYSGSATVQVDTNAAGLTQTTGNVLLVSLPASATTMLWSGTASFSSAAPILLDLGRHDTTNGYATASPDVNGNYWNNLSGPNSASSVVPVGTKVTNMVNVTNGATTVGIETLTGGWNANGLVNGGLFQPYGPQTNLLGTFAIETATMDYFFTSTNDVFKLTGLNTGSLYTLSFFGSRSNTENRITSFAVGPTSVTLRTSGPLSGASAAGTNRNDHEVAVLGSIAPNAGGIITVTVTKVSGAFAHLNLMQIEETPAALPPAGILASPTSLSFAGTNGGPNPASQSFGLTNVGSSTLNYTLATNAGWLSVAPVSGTLAAGAAQQVTVSIDVAGLSAGTSNAMITIADPAASNSPQTISVSLALSGAAPSASTTQAVFLVDFGRHDSGTNGLPISNPDQNGNYWNNFSPVVQGGLWAVVSNGSRVVDLVTTTNSSSSLAVEITSGGWSANGILNGGLTNPSPALLGMLSITNATMDYIYTAASDTLKLTGLNTGLVYDLTFFGTRDFASTRTSTYTAGTNTVNLTTSGAGIGAGGVNHNNNTTAVLRALAPNASGEIPVTVSVAAGGFAYVGILKIEEILPGSGGGSPAPGLEATPSSLSFAATNGAGNPPAQGFGLTNVGSGMLTFTVATNAGWLSVSPVSGSITSGAGQQLTVSVNTSGLQPGTSNATITITDTAASNSPQTVSVSLALAAAQTVTTQEVILVDFGNDSSYRGTNVLNPDPNGRYWNSVYSGAYYANLVNHSNTATAVDLGFDADSGTDSFNGPGGAFDAAALGALGVTNAVNDYYVNSRFQIQSLDTGRTYRLTFFGSHKFSPNTSTVYSVCTDTNYNTVVASTNLAVQVPGSPALHNSNRVAVLANLTPQPNGRLYVKFEGDAGSNGYLNAMMIESLSVSGGGGSGPGILASPSSLSFVTTNGSANPPAQSFGLTNVGTATLNYTLATNAGWLSVSPASGALAPGAGQQMTVTVNATNLSAGLSNAVITISDPAATNTPRTVSVSLNIKSGAPVLAIFGSSVAKGWASSGQASGVTTNGSWTNSYSYFITTYLSENGGYYVTNASIPGENTATAVSRFPGAIVPNAPDYVLIAYSLGNEGFAGTTDPTSSSIVSNFTLNLQNLIGQCRTNGFYPVLSSVYPRGDYTAGNYAHLKQMHLTINSWNVPSLNLLTPLDDGSGRWVTGFWADGWHPNDAGYLEFYRAFVPSLLAAVQSGKTNSPTFGSATNFARLASAPGVNTPLVFTPTNAVHSFTMAFRMRTLSTGTLAAVRSGADYSTLELRSNQLVYVSRAGAETVMSTNLANGAWHDLAISSRYALSNTAVYVDGALAGSIPERYVPDQFVLGGPAGSGRAATPALADLQNWCVYRAGWTVDEALAQKNGNLQQSSMEIGAMLDDAAFTNGAAALNRAQSLSVALVNTASLLPWNSGAAGLVDAPKLLIFGSSVAKGWNGGGSITNGSYALGYAGRLTPVLEASGWTVTNGSVGGDTTTLLNNRFDSDAVPVGPDVILIGLSLGNEGLLSNPDTAYESFRSGMTNLIQRSRANGFYPVIAHVYPHTAYDTNHYAYVRRMNLLLNSWDVPGVNLLGPVDDGAGHWAAGYRSDDAHPNTAGHEEMFYAIVPTLFDAILAGKTNTPQLAGTHGYARLQGADARPFTFAPARTMHSFNTAFRVRAGSTGTVAAVMTATGAPPVTAPATFLVDFGRHDGGTHGNATVSPDVNGHYWNNISPADPLTNNNVAIGTAINNMITVSNAPTSVRLEITSSGWAANGRLNGGLLSPSNSLLGKFAVGTATEDYFFHDTTNTFKIAGLTPSSTYKLRFFGTRLSTETRIATFTVGSASTNHQTSGTGIGTYVANQNDDEIAELSGLSPNGSGEISVSVAKAGLSFAHLGILEIIETPGTNAPAGGAIELRGNSLVYVGTNGSEIAASIDADDGSWVDVALSHSYARGLTMLYVDGVFAGTLAEQLAPVQFVLGGPGSLTNRPAAPAVLDLQDWCVYRAPWTPEEAMAQHTGALQQASMEICLPLDDTSFPNGGSASNRAQSLAPASIAGTNISAGAIALPPGNLQATSPAYNTVRLSWSDTSGTESGFVVERRAAGSSSFWSNRVVLAANTTSHVDHAVAAGTYEYRVSAQEGSLQGDYAGPAAIAVSDAPFSSVVPVAAFQFSGGRPGLSFVGSNAVVYTLQFSTNLLDPSGWEYVLTSGAPVLVIGNGTTTDTLSDTNLLDRTCVYRLMSAP